MKNLLTILLLAGFLGVFPTEATSEAKPHAGEETVPIRTADDWKMVKENYERRLGELDGIISRMKAILRGIFLVDRNEGVKRLREEMRAAQQTIDHANSMIEAMDKARLADDEGVVFDNPKVGSHALDVCREWGRNCGKPAADAWCKVKGYNESIAHTHKEKNPPTKVISSKEICDKWFCGRITSVTCR